MNDAENLLATNIATVLEAFPKGTAIMLLQEDGEPLNVAIRALDLDGNMSWALGGKTDPFTSAELGRIMATRGLTWNELEVAL